MQQLNVIGLNGVDECKDEMTVGNKGHPLSHGYLRAIQVAVVSDGLMEGRKVVHC